MPVAVGRQAAAGAPVFSNDDNDDIYIYIYIYIYKERAIIFFGVTCWMLVTGHHSRCVLAVRARHGACVSRERERERERERVDSTGSVHLIGSRDLADSIIFGSYGSFRLYRPFLQTLSILLGICRIYGAWGLTSVSGGHSRIKDKSEVKAYTYIYIYIYIYIQSFGESGCMSDFRAQAL